jgi:hypothetical protein
MVAAGIIEGPLSYWQVQAAGKHERLHIELHIWLKIGLSPYSILAVTFTNKAAKR